MNCLPENCFCNMDDSNADLLMCYTLHRPGLGILHWTKVIKSSRTNVVQTLPRIGESATASAHLFNDLFRIRAPETCITFCDGRAQIVTGFGQLRKEAVQENCAKTAQLLVLLKTESRSNDSALVSTLGENEKALVKGKTDQRKMGIIRAFNVSNTPAMGKLLRCSNFFHTCLTHLNPITLQTLILHGP
jgi:hypothetical protein